MVFSLYKALFLDYGIWPLFKALPYAFGRALCSFNPTYYVTTSDGIEYLYMTLTSLPTILLPLPQLQHTPQTIIKPIRLRDVRLRNCFHLIHQKNTCRILGFLNLLQIRLFIDN